QTGAGARHRKRTWSNESCHSDHEREGQYASARNSTVSAHTNRKLTLKLIVLLWWRRLLNLRWSRVRLAQRRFVRSNLWSAIVEQLRPHMRRPGPRFSGGQRGNQGQQEKQRESKFHTSNLSVACTHTSHRIWARIQISPMLTSKYCTSVYHVRGITAVSGG